jgi:DNA-directed RNA polymerase subunit M/transcription elongation factor TFIIS
MPAKSEIANNNVDEEFRVCPACGYEYGFHTSFLRIDAGKNFPVKSTREVYRVILICPECGARYDVGWRVSFAGAEPRVVRTTGHQVSIT